MALTLIAQPNALPTVQADYVSQNDLLNAIFLDPDKISHFDFDNDEIPQGTIVNHGGAIYKAVTAESISGTKSIYVKIDVSTHTASYVSSLSGVTWNGSYNGYYDGSGHLYLFDEATAFFNGDITSRKLVYSRLRKQIFEEIGVTKPNWTRLLQISEDQNISGSANSTLCALDENTIVHIDAINESLQAYSFDGYTITALGSGLSISGITLPYITALSSTEIAYIDATNNELRKYTFNGSTWSLTGSGLAITGANSPNICKIDTDTVALVDLTAGNGELRTYDFDGSNWAQVGNGLAITGITGRVYIVQLDTDEVALIDTGNEELRKYSFDGTDWSLEGTGLTPSGTVSVAKICSLNKTDVMMIRASDHFEVYRFEYGVWTLKSDIFYLSGMSGPTITKVKSNQIAYIDVTEADLRVYHIFNEPKAIE